MKILMSIKPQYSEQIFNGEKLFEFRVKIPTKAKKEIDTIVVYETSPTKMIVGEFKIKNIISDKPSILWEKTYKRGIERILYDKYFNNRDIGYAIEILKPKRYNKSLTLDEIGKKYPPQSFCYID